ncbi:hypothetical protein BGX27_001579 [Mortierella sp. AM989]|nr:hypothetical protein BGX27_001579 [Mortierella sp. AM989]
MKFSPLVAVITLAASQLMAVAPVPEQNDEGCLVTHSISGGYDFTMNVASTSTSAKASSNASVAYVTSGPTVVSPIEQAITTSFDLSINIHSVALTPISTVDTMITNTVVPVTPSTVSAILTSLSASTASTASSVSTNFMVSTTSTFLAVSTTLISSTFPNTASTASVTFTTSAHPYESDIPILSGLGNGASSSNASMILRATSILLSLFYVI